MAHDPFDDEQTIDRLRARREQRDDLAAVRKDSGEAHLDYLTATAPADPTEALKDSGDQPLDGLATTPDATAVRKDSGEAHLDYLTATAPADPDDAPSAEAQVDARDFLVWQRNVAGTPIDGPAQPTADTPDVHEADQLVPHTITYTDVVNVADNGEDAPTGQPDDQPTANQYYDAASPYLAATDQPHQPDDEPTTTTDEYYDAASPYLAATAEPHQPGDGPTATANPYYDASSPYLAATDQPEQSDDEERIDEAASKSGTDVAMEDLQVLEGIDPSTPDGTVGDPDPTTSPSTTSEPIKLAVEKVERGFDTPDDTDGTAGDPEPTTSPSTTTEPIELAVEKIERGFDTPDGTDGTAGDPEPTTSPSTTTEPIELAVEKVERGFDTPDGTDGADGTVRLRDALLDDDITRADAIILKRVDGTTPENFRDLGAGTDTTPTVEAIGAEPGGGEHDVDDVIVAAPLDVSSGEPHDASSHFRPEIDDEVVVALAADHEEEIDFYNIELAVEDPTSDVVSQAFTEAPMDDIVPPAPSQQISELDVSESGLDEAEDG